MIVLTDKEVCSDAGKWVHRLGTRSYFRRCGRLPDDTADMFEEADAVPEETDAVPEETESAKPTLEEQIKALAKVQTRTMSLKDDEALSMPDCFDSFEELVGQEVQAGRIIRFGDELWKVRQAHTVQAHYPPSMATAALYERVDREHAGTIEDPIPYSPSMEIFAGKYYIQGGTVYRCTRDSGQALTHDLSALTGIYVETL